MSAVELAVEKRRLQMAAAEQRKALKRYAQGMLPLFETADQVHAGARWIGRHPEALAAGVAFLAVVRPGVRRFAWNWSKRAFVAWRFWRSVDPARHLPLSTRG